MKKKVYSAKPGQLFDFDNEGNRIKKQVYYGKRKSEMRNVDKYGDKMWSEKRRAQIKKEFTKKALARTLAMMSGEVKQEYNLLRELKEE